jgi:hypothetical protein
MKRTRSARSRRNTCRASTAEIWPLRWTLRQGCLLLLKQPILEQGTLDGLRDHVLRLRDEVPYDSRTFSTMKLFGSLLRQLECQPKDLFFWEAVLTESRDLVQRIKPLWFRACAL